MPKGYTTRAKIENYMLITIDPTFYAQVDEWITDIEEYIDRDTGRNFVADAEDSDRLYDGTGTDKLLIDDAISISDVQLAIGDSEVVDPDDLVKYPANYAAKKLPICRLELRNGVFGTGKQNITATGKWGFSEEPPGDIQLCATVLVSGIINYSYSSDGEVQSESIGRYSVTYKDDKQWSDFERVPKVLESYKKFTM